MFGLKHNPTSSTSDWTQLSTLPLNLTPAYLLTTKTKQQFYTVYHFDQVLLWTLPVMKDPESTTSWQDALHRAHYFCGALANCPTHTRWGNTSKTQISDPSINIHIFKSQRLKKDWEAVTDWGSWGDTTKCNMWPWAGLWSRRLSEDCIHYHSCITWLWISSSFCGDVKCNLCGSGEESNRFTTPLICIFFSGRGHLI